MAGGSTGSDDIVMRLVLKGQEPGEAARLARMPIEAVRAEYAAGVQKIQSAFTSLHLTQTAEYQKSAKAQIKQEQEKTKVIAALLKDLEREQKASTQAALQVALAAAKERQVAEKAAAAAAKAAAMESAAADKAAARESSAAARALAAEIKAAERDKEASRKAALAAAKAADAEIQRMGRLQSQAIAENARRDAEAVKAVEKARAEAARAAQINWRQWLEIGENAVTVYRGILDAIGMVASKARQFGEEIIATTNVFGSLQGSIESARQATQNTVSDMELIKSKNAAMAAGLDLSEQQFAEVAKAADAYGDAVGISAKDALDPMVASLAAGNERFLKRIGVLVDAQKAEEKYASVLEKTRDELTEQEKRYAFVSEAVEQLRKQNEKLNDSPPTFALTIEQAFVGAKNAWDNMIAGIGQFQVPRPLVEFFDKFGRFAREYGRQYQSATGDRDLFGTATKTLASMASGKAGVNDAADALAARGITPFNRVLTPDQDEGDPAFLTRKRFNKPHFEKARTPYDFLADYLRDASRRVEAATIEAENARQDALALLGERFDPTTGKFEESETGAAERYADQRLEQIGSNFAGSRFSPEQYNRFAEAQGKAARAAQLKQAQGISLRDARAGVGNLDEDFVKDLEAKIAESREKAGGGLLGQLLFGDDTSLDQTYDKLDKFKQGAIDTAKEVADFYSGAANQMAGAIGGALAASIGENANFKKGLKERTHAVLMSLAAEGLTRAAMETALGLASLAFPATAADAPKHFAAAAAFGAVGVAAGIGARATNSATSAAGSTPTSVRGSSAGTSSTGRSSNSSGDNINITVVWNGGFTSDEEAERQVDRLMAAFKRRTGREPGERN